MLELLSALRDQTNTDHITAGEHHDNQPLESHRRVGTGLFCGGGPAGTTDCEKAAKHDHRAEKGMPTPMSAQCADMAANAASGAPKKPLHDHQKVHK
jgi:hypothetical protein